MGNQPTKQNVNQTGKQKKYVHWKSAEVPSAPGRPILVPVSDQQPDAITLQWEKPQSDGGSPILGYIIEHRRIGATSWIRSVPMLITKNTASIAGLEPGWKYQFRVIAENFVGHSQPSILSDPLPVSLQMRNANTLPKFITELKDTNANENERLEMRVRVFGNPQPEISWFKDGFEIFSSRRIKIVNENDFSMLIIHQVALTDEGEIKCTATNRSGHVVTRAKLIVEAPPKIRLPRNYEDGLIIEEDDVLKLKAGIAGQPFPAVIWSREGKVISDGKKFEISTTDKHTLLKIGKVKRTDRGEYSIRAINKLGEDIASFLVTVTAKPRSPGKVKLMKSHGTSVTLAWTEPEDDGGCKIGSYIVEYFRIGWDVWLKATTTRQLQTTLKDLIEGSEYKFRVKAENPYGVSDPSAESDILHLRSSQLQQTETTLSISDNVTSKVGRKPVEQSRSPIRGGSPLHRIIKPELFESEQLKMEMSYGAPAVDDSNTNSSKITKDKEDRGTSPNPVLILKHKSPIPTPRKNHNNLTLEIGSTQNASEQLLRTPSPKIEITPTIEPPRRSLSPKSKSEEKPASPTASNKNASPLIMRRSLSPNQPKILSETELKIQERLKKEQEKDQMKSNKTKTLHPEQALKQNGNLNPKMLSENVLKKSFEYLFNKMNNNENNEKIYERSKNNDESPRIIQEPNQNDLTDQQLSSDAEGKPKDEVHTSNEYMLVFYPDGRAKEIEEPESRNYYAGDRPPTLSYSFPNLSTLEEFSFQVNIRRSASSTELLYEKAMARFYEAVEIEEEKKDRKKISHLGEHLSIQKTTLQNLDSIAESQEILGSMQFHNQQNDNALSLVKENNNNSVTEEFEEYKKSVNALENNENVDALSENLPSPVNRRNILEMTENQHVSSLNNHDNFENYRDDIRKEEYEDPYKHFSDKEVEENTRINSLFDDEKELELEYDSDYTESTASESESSMEYFKREVITRSTSGNIGRKKVTLSPVRYQSEDDSLPSTPQINPISSSDSIPKSILKKPPSSENVVNPTPTSSSNPSPVPNINQNNKIAYNSDQNLSSNPNSTSNLYSNPNYYSNSYSNSNPYSNANLNSNPKLHSNPNSNPNPSLNSNISSNPNPNLNPNLNSNPNPHSKSNTKTNPDVHSNPKLNAISNPNPHTNPKPPSPSNPNLNPNPNLYLNPNEDRRNSEDLKTSPKLSPLSKAKSVSDRKLKGFKSFLTGGRSKSSKDKKKSKNDQPSTSQATEDKVDVKKTPETPKEPVKVAKPVTDEGAMVVVDYYSSIVEELGHSKYKTPLYLNTDELKKHSERAQLEDIKFKHNNDIDDDEDLFLLQQKSKPRLSIVERMQTKHVRQEKSSHCIDNKIIMAVPETPLQEIILTPKFEISPPQRPSLSHSAAPSPATATKKVVKIKKIVKRARSKSRDTSKTKGATQMAGALPSILIDSSDLERLRALHDEQNDKPGEEEISLLEQYAKSEAMQANQNQNAAIVKYDSEEANIEANENVHSAISYVTDLGLFCFACWVYLFKDAYMVLPILALIVYRRIGDAIRRNLPSFLKKKPC